MTRCRFSTSVARSGLAVLALVVAAPGAHGQDRERRGPPGAQGAPAGQPPAATSAAPAAAPQTTSSYLQSCRNSTTSSGRLFSECRTPAGQYRRSSIEVGRCVGDIGNQNGILGCNGAVAQDGGLVVEDTGRGGATRAGGGDRNDNTSGRGGYDNGRGSNNGSGYNNGGYGAGGTRNDDRGSYNGGGYNSGGGYNGGAGYNNGGGYDNAPTYNNGGYSNGGGGYNGPGPGYANGGGSGRGRADVVLFEGPNYTGRSFEVSRDIDDLKREGFNDRARSVRIYSGRWKLCREANFSRCEHLTRDVPDLNALNAGAQISSIERE